MTSQDLIEKYESKISTIEEVLDDLDRNIKISEKGVLVTDEFIEDGKYVEGINMNCDDPKYKHRK
jgi:hypothetical protein